MYAGVLAYAAARVPSFAFLVAAVGVFGALLLAFVLVRRVDDLLPWALGMLGVAYTISLFVHGSAVDDAAPLVAAGLLLCGELAAWSLDERHAIAAERDVWLQRALALGALVLAGLGAAAAVVGFAASSAGDGLAWTVLGSVAAVLAVGVGGAARTADRLKPLRYTSPLLKAHSSSGLGHRPLTAAARVRIPYAPLSP